MNTTDATVTEGCRQPLLHQPGNALPVETASHRCSVLLPDDGLSHVQHVETASHRCPLLLQVDGSNHSVLRLFLDGLEPDRF